MYDDLNSPVVRVCSMHHVILCIIAYVTSQYMKPSNTLMYNEPLTSFSVVATSPGLDDWSPGVM